MSLQRLMGTVAKAEDRYLMYPMDRVAAKAFAEELLKIGKVDKAAHILSQSLSKSQAWSQAQEEPGKETPPLIIYAKKPNLLLNALLLVFFGELVWLAYYAWINEQQKEEVKGATTSSSESNILSRLMPLNYAPKVATNVNQRLSDLKGMDEITEEIFSLIKMVKHPEKYKSKGAKVPKGLLLYGKPGTGKTMLARAIAGEAGVPFFYCTGSEFDEMYVGVGARRVRQLFKEAKKKKRCIIFIDEIDTLFTKTRRNSVENSSSRATINEVLSQIDGFTPSDNILVIGATNNYDMLDPAAIRPGRFDYKIHIPLPDVKGREEIFKLYISRIVHDFSLDTKKLAQMTPGFSGAEIKNLVNIAITQAVRERKEHATMKDFEYARDLIIMGIERGSLKIEEKEKMNTAIHEVGHTLATFYTDGPEHIYKVTIVPRGGSLGATYHVPDERQILCSTKQELMNRLCSLLGGYVAEKLFIGRDKITTGCSNDLEKATELAYGMVRQLGMVEDYGVIHSSKEQLSDEENKRVDEAVQKLLKNTEERVEKILKEHETEVRDLSKKLLQYEYLTGEDVKNIIEGKFIEKQLLT